MSGIPSPLSMSNSSTQVSLAKLSPLSTPFPPPFAVPVLAGSSQSLYTTMPSQQAAIFTATSSIVNAKWIPVVPTTPKWVPFSFPYDVVIAHGPGCKDGATAAWCWWRKLPADYQAALQTLGDFYDYPRKGNFARKGDDDYVDSPAGAVRLQQSGYPVVFTFAQPNTQIPVALIKNKRVLILDLDLGAELLPVVREAAFTMLCDHHTSTPDTVSNNASGLFAYGKFGMFVDTRKSESGASLSWKLSHSTELPRFVQIVRIGDTWQFDSEDNRKLHAKEVLRTMHQEGTFTSFPGIENGFALFDDNFTKYVNRGSTLLDFDHQIIKTICKQCDLGVLTMNDGTKYTIAYAQCNVMHSEVGAGMRFYAGKRFPGVKIDLCATWKYVSHRNVVSVSLRDSGPGIILSEVARNVADSDGEGGGHDTASSFKFEGLENFHKFIQRYTPLS